MKNVFKKFVLDETGMQTGEYMVLGTVMAAGSITAVAGVRDGMVDKFDSLTDGLDVNATEGEGG